MGHNYKFFQHGDCEWFPCHTVSDGVLNCLFCYCPLYQYDDCDGEFKILESGLKDCSDCLLPHSDDGYEKIIAKIIAKNDKQKRKKYRII